MHLLARIALAAMLSATAAHAQGPALGPGQAPGPSGPGAASATAPGTVTPGPVTAEQAAALKSRIEGWLIRLIGLDGPQGTDAVRVTAAGDHFSVAQLGAGPTGLDPIPGIEVDVRPIGDGRFLFLTPGGPGAGTFNLGALAAARGATGASAGDGYRGSYGRFEVSGVWDPSYATPSDYTVRVADVRAVAGPDGSPAADMSPADTLKEGVAALRVAPAAGEVTPGRVDARVDVSGTGYAHQPAVSGAPAADGLQSLTLGTFRIGTGFAGVAPDNAARMTRAMARMSRPQPGDPPALPGGRSNPAGVQLAMGALRGFSSGTDLAAEATGFAVATGDGTFSAGHARAGYVFTVAEGTARFALDVAMEDIAVASPALQAYASLFPHGFSIRPVITGLPVQPLLDMYQKTLLQPDYPGSQADILALLSRDGVKAGLERFSLDVGGATISGTADWRIGLAANGTAHIVADKLDALMATLQSRPEFAQAVPALLLVKGLGRVEDGKTVWDIVASPGKVFVNGVDVAGMAGRTP